MSVESHLERLRLLLSSEDLHIFEQLAQKLKDVSGDFDSLSDNEKQLILSMEEKYGAQIRGEAVNNAEEIIDDQAVMIDEFPMLKTEFANYVKDMLLRELAGEHADLKSAVTYAFDKRWMPTELQSPDICETLFERFFTDIENANRWREQFQCEKIDLNNKSMAVGLTWFMYIFQLKQWVDKFHS